MSRRTNKQRNATNNTTSSSILPITSTTTSSHTCIPTTTTSSPDISFPETVLSTTLQTPSSSVPTHLANESSDPEWRTFAESINSTVYPFQEAAEEDIATLQLLLPKDEVSELRVRILRDRIILHFHLTSEPTSNTVVTARYDTLELARCIGCDAIGIIGNPCTADQCEDTGNIFANSFTSTASSWPNVP